MLNIDRFQMGKLCLETALSNCGLNDIELLVLDNGSTDKRAIEYLSKIADVFISEKQNIGVAKGFNKLLRKATGQYIALIDNDILLNKGWLKDLLYFNKQIKNSGISAIHCVLEKGEYNGNVFLPPNGIVYSTRFFNRAFLNNAGGFDETISIYGYEDSQYCIRSVVGGYMNYYIPNQSSIHLGEDFSSDNEFRKFKNEQLKINLPKFQESIRKVVDNRNYKIPL